MDRPYKHAELEAKYRFYNLHDNDLGIYLLMKLAPYLTAGHYMEVPMPIVIWSLHSLSKNLKSVPIASTLTATAFIGTHRQATF